MFPAARLAGDGLQLQGCLDTGEVRRGLTLDLDSGHVGDEGGTVALNPRELTTLEPLSEEAARSRPRRPAGQRGIWAMKLRNRPTT